MKANKLEFFFPPYFVAHYDNPKTSGLFLCNVTVWECNIVSVTLEMDGCVVCPTSS